MGDRQAHLQGDLRLKQHAQLPCDMHTAGCAAQSSAPKCRSGEQLSIEPDPRQADFVATQHGSMSCRVDQLAARALAVDRGINMKLSAWLDHSCVLSSSPTCDDGAIERIDADMECCSRALASVSCDCLHAMCSCVIAEAGATTAKVTNRLRFRQDRPSRSANEARPG